MLRSSRKKTRTEKDTRKGERKEPNLQSSKRRFQTPSKTYEEGRPQTNSDWLGTVSEELRKEDSSSVEQGLQYRRSKLGRRLSKLEPKN
jgi:hypothetical protein